MASLIAVSNAALKYIAAFCPSLKSDGTTKLWKLTLSHINNVFSGDLPNEVIMNITMEKQNIAFEWDHFCDMCYDGDLPSHVTRHISLDETSECEINDTSVSDSLNFLVINAMRYFPEKLRSLYYDDMENTDPDARMHQLNDELQVFVDSHVNNIYDIIPNEVSDIVTKNVRVFENKYSKYTTDGDLE